ncbi:Zinc finger protein 648 [Camelus dromedarius]|uniref:Zinc finger protein 648 n=1 Tax=Camelus dromedarius TaxID=9838 RepID=A0A5N4CNX6_CAMDR|nr:zinc finger protein 648 [Camelus dromedarius]KAB1260635.1 Zinc finger protein 648 [Camelus dromedarius]
MAQMEPQDQWGQVSPLCRLTQEAYAPQMLCVNLDSKDEAGGGAGDKKGTGGPDHQACPRGSSQVTEDNPDLPWQHQPRKKEEKFSDSCSAQGMGKNPMTVPGKTRGERDETKITPTQDSTGASMILSALPRGLSHTWFSRTQSLRGSLPAGNDGDSRANLNAALGVPSNFPGSGKYFCAQKGVDKPPDSSSLVCVPKVGGSWDLSTQEAHTPAQGSATPASLAEAVLAEVQKGLKGQEPGGAGEGRRGEVHPYKCLRGGRAFQKPSHPMSPTQTPGAKPYACELCGKAYSHRGTLQQHQRLHTGERPYQCPFCDKAYTWSSDHRKHIRTHTGEKPYPCPDCGKAFVRSSDLRKHQRNMHSNDKPFPCAECGLTFNKPLSLLRHQRTHLGEKPFRCPTCDREFAVASRMMEHQRVHSGERPFPCSTCGKCFTKSSNLIEHQTLHTGQRPFKCADCGVAFAQPSRLARHQRIHTGERPFPCPQCGQAFARSSTLKRHQQIHSGEKAFLCAECGRAFRVASELAQHIRVHNGERPYQCEDCGQAFTRSNHLQRHRARHRSCKKEPIPCSSDE